MSDLSHRISACRLCAPRFAATATRHAPRPVTWFAPGARILVVGQAPGMRVHQSGRPFTDRSGDRLRDWMGVDQATFYDRARIAIVPMAFCFPGYDGKGADLPPPPICAATWRAQVLDLLQPDLTLLVAVTQCAGIWAPAMSRKPWPLGAITRRRSFRCRILRGAIPAG